MVDRDGNTSLDSRSGHGRTTTAAGMDAAGPPQEQASSGATFIPTMADDAQGVAKAPGLLSTPPPPRKNDGPDPGVATEADGILATDIRQEDSNGGCTCDISLSFCRIAYSHAC
jgi:hypothetical protein